MQNSFKENINTIKEIYPGTFQIILGFASNKFIDYILKESFKYIWFHNFSPENDQNWINYELPISENLKKNVLARQISFDFIIETHDYNQIKNELPNGVTLIQINELPKHYLDLRKITGKTRYELLKKECDYLFEIDLPNTVDYGTLISPDKEYLTGLLNNSDINWKDLP